MPELPEVEAARRAIEENCLGKKITKALIADDPKVIDGVSRADFEASLLGKTIVSAHRKGKNLWLRLDSPPFPSFQFGMAGAIYIKGVAVTKYKRSAVKDTDEWPSKYSKLFVELDDGLEFSFTDKRRFARVRLLKDPASVPPISELGPDALLEPMTGDELFESLSKKKIAIKTLLLDQSYISGIGNWVADEVLYQARIHPEQSAASLSKENYGNLHKSIKEVIEYAVQVDADSIQFPREWLFHFRWGKKPRKVIEKSLEVGADSSQFPSNWIFHSREKKPGKAFVDGRKIDFITVGSRTTAYVPELQKLSGQQAARAGSKQANKRKGHGDGVNDDVNEAASDEEVNGSVQSKKGRKPRGQGKRSSVKRKSKESDDEDNANDSEDDDDDDNDDHHDEDQKNKTRKVTNNKQSKVEKTSKKTVQTSQNSKKMKKAK
ncbi:formamidopyrimidine-DNA glycosylase isoform X5 [Prunus avium]|uniref:Formamidopyrimidine-DNA glycosylase isoform X5 n=1 Tax=Prunus avium TaxID=42229 RepID=A0A6P5TH15_PRUAV|nr:formamidopyrimidine-DNA glycosylase isoform X5 [Prunus avium]